MCDKMFQPRGTSEIGKQESTTNLTAITSANPITSASSAEIRKYRQNQLQQNPITSASTARISNYQQKQHTQQY